MKKCYWCAEEIQDEARICRYCGRDTVDPTSVNFENIESEKSIQDSSSSRSGGVGDVSFESTDNALLQNKHELPPLKWHQNLFVRADIFGFLMSILLNTLTMNSTPLTEVFGYSGQRAQALMQSLTNLLIFAFYYLLFGYIWRGLNHKGMKTDPDKREGILKIEPLFVFISSFLFNLFLSALLN